MKLFTHKSITVFLILILLATVFTFFQNKSVVKLDNGKTVIVDKYSNNAEVKVEKSDVFSSLWEIIQTILKFIARLIGDNNPGPPNPTPPDPSDNICQNSVYNESAGNCVVKIDGGSDNQFRRIGTQGHETDWCLCYSLGYGNKIINQSYKMETRTTACSSHGTNYIASTEADVFDAIRTQILTYNKPVAVRLYNSACSTSKSHFILVRAMKASAANKNKADLRYSDFYVVDPVGTSKQPSTSENPPEMMWDKLISKKSSSCSLNRKLQKKDGKYSYYVPNATRP